jgi:hypothetical protein
MYCLHCSKQFAAFKLHRMQCPFLKVEFMNEKLFVASSANKDIDLNFDQYDSASIQADLKYQRRQIRNTQSANELMNTMTSIFLHMSEFVISQFNDAVFYPHTNRWCALSRLVSPTSTLMSMCERMALHYRCTYSHMQQVLAFAMFGDLVFGTLVRMVLELQQRTGALIIHDMAYVCIGVQPYVVLPSSRNPYVRVRCDEKHDSPHLCGRLLSPKSIQSFRVIFAPVSANQGPILELPLFGSAPLQFFTFAKRGPMLSVFQTKLPPVSRSTFARVFSRLVKNLV